MFPSHLEITCKQLEDLCQSDTSHRLIDCREIDEFNYCHLPNSELIPLSSFPQTYHYALSKKEEHIIIYCHHGVRSLQATHFLRDLGFTNVFSLAGGIDKWSLTIDTNIPRY